MHRFPAIALVICAALASAGCESMRHSEMPAVPHVELARFMGPWHVIASIPTHAEKDAYNGVESYRLDSDGTIDTTFTFNKGSLEGQQKVVKARGFVKDTQSNARWGMRLVWPVKAEYVIAYLDESYSQTIIARSKRDYVWIMARDGQISEADYARLLQLVAGLGYDISKVKRVPQRAS